MSELEHLSQLNSDGKVKHTYKSIKDIIPRVDKSTEESYGIVKLASVTTMEPDATSTSNDINVISVVKTSDADEPYTTIAGTNILIVSEGE